MTNLTPVNAAGTVVAIPAFVCAAGGGTDLMLHQPLTLAVDVAGTGYSDGAATMVLADGNTIGVTLTTDDGSITALAWASGYSTSASDTGVVAVVQEGGADGTAHVATYSTVATTSPCLLDFGTLRDFADFRRGAVQYTLSLKTVTEHDTAPGNAKTVKVNRYWSDELITLPVSTVLAARKTAGGALTLTNAIDTTQYFEACAAFAVNARYLYLTFDVVAMDAGASFTAEVRLNRV